MLKKIALKYTYGPQVIRAFQNSVSSSIKFWVKKCSLALNFALEFSEKTGLDCKYKQLGCAAQKFRNNKFDCLILGNPIISDELNNKKSL